MNQSQGPQSGKAESFKATTNEPMSKTTDQPETSPISTFERSIGTPDDLIAAIRIAQAQGKDRVLVTQRCLTFFIGESKDAGFTMMGVHVVDENRKEEYFSALNKTIEQVNFPKA